MDKLDINLYGGNATSICSEWKCVSHNSLFCSRDWVSELLLNFDSSLSKYMASSPETRCFTEKLMCHTLGNIRTWLYDEL